MTQKTMTYSILLDDSLMDHSNSDGTHLSSDDEDDVSDGEEQRVVPQTSKNKYLNMELGYVAINEDFEKQLNYHEIFLFHENNFELF